MLIEDASRPARTSNLVGMIVAELLAARPSPARIDLVFAGGAHLGLEPENRRHKLPPSLPCAIHQHDARHPAVTLGRTASGLPVALNPLVAEADLVAGIGTVNFHPAAGFSGGAKLILPGVASLQTIAEHHSLPRTRRASSAGSWRAEIEEAARLVPFHFLAAMLTRPDGGIAGLWAGDPSACEAAARAELMRYARPIRPEPAALCLIGMAPFDRSLLGFFKCVDLGPELLRPDGTLIVAGACPQGAGRHLWRWSPETIRAAADAFPALVGERRVFLYAPGAPPEIVRDLLPKQVVPLSSRGEVRELLAKVRGRGYLVPYGPLTAFAGPPGPE